MIYKNNFYLIHDETTAEFKRDDLTEAICILKCWYLVVQKQKLRFAVKFTLITMFLSVFTTEKKVMSLIR